MGNDSSKNDKDPGQKDDEEYDSSYTVKFDESGNIVVDEPKKGGPKKEEPKKEEPRKPDEKREEPKKEPEIKTQEPKKIEFKKEEQKTLGESPIKIKEPLIRHNLSRLKLPRRKILIISLVIYISIALASAAVIQKWLFNPPQSTIKNPVGTQSPSPQQLTSNPTTPTPSTPPATTPTSPPTTPLQPPPSPPSTGSYKCPSDYCKPPLYGSGPCPDGTGKYNEQECNDYPEYSSNAQECESNRVIYYKVCGVRQILS